MNAEKEIARYHYALIALVVIVIILGFLLGLAIISKSSTSSSAPSMEGMPGMQLATFPVPAGEPVPTIGLELTKTADGWNVYLPTTNFTFTPEKIDGAPAPGEGHVHLYVDGKLIVVLGPWYHLDALSPGTHTIRAALANNNHTIYAVNGAYVQAQQTISQ